MSELQCIARLRIHDGKLDEFKRLAAKCVEVVRTKERRLFLKSAQAHCRQSPSSPFICLWNSTPDYERIRQFCFSGGFKGHGRIVSHHTQRH